MSDLLKNIDARTKLAGTNKLEILMFSLGMDKRSKREEKVKTSLGPGSRAVTEYLKAAGLLGYLEQIGFHVVGFGCTT